MAQDPLGALLVRGEEVGCLELSHVQETADTLELEDEEVAALCETIEERGIELRDDCGRTAEGAAYGNGEVAALTADTLGMFLREIGRYPLLTADEEVELARRIGQGTTWRASG